MEAIWALYAWLITYSKRHKVLLQEIRLAEESSRQNASPMSSQEKAELAHSRTQMLLQLARWMAHTGQGAKADVTGEHFFFCPIGQRLGQRVSGEKLEGKTDSEGMPFDASFQQAQQN